MSTLIPASPASATTQDAVTADELCTRIQSLARHDEALVCDFARIFIGRAPRALLEERSADELAAMTLGAWEFLNRARPDQVNVEVADPRDEGWKAPVSVIRTEVGDRPFIVDTIREYLTGENIPILQYVYPVLRVDRGPGGEITAVGTSAGGGEQLEALGHIEIPHLARRERADEIRGEVARRLTDVVEATRDFSAMVQQLERVHQEVAGLLRRFPDRADEYGEFLEFLGWLRAGNFVFLGFRAYEIVGAGGDAAVRVVPGSGLGILADEGRSQYSAPKPVSQMRADFRERVLRGPLLIVSKANRESTVHRRARMDYVGVKRLDAQGNVAGEWRFLGLFTSQAYSQSPNAIPIIRKKFKQILDESGTREGSHDYKEIISILHELPKEELFQASTEQLRDEVNAVLGHLFSDDVRVALRPDPMRGDTAAMVILPRGRFSPEVRRDVGELLQERLGGTVRDKHLAMGGTDQARLHFYLSHPDGPPNGWAADVAGTERALEREVALLLRDWDDLLEDELAAGGADPGEARRLARAYGQAFGEDYRAANNAAAARRDVLRMEEMLRSGATVSLLLRPGVEGETIAAGATVLRLYLAGERLVLSDFMPILEDHGVRVLEVDTFEFQAGDALPQLMVYAFHVQTRDGRAIPEELYAALAESLLASRAGDAQKDQYASLTLVSGLRWREVDVVRTYANYASQIGAVPSRLSPVRAFLSYPRVARLLVELFHVRCVPGKKPAKAELERIRGELHAELEKVTSLADDRALRRLVNLVEATVRTNYFRHGGAEPTVRSGGVPYISIKVRSADMEELKKTRLLYEVYVHSSRMEGVHLRAAPVSRGGIRWSDRPDDFRTEVMGLVQTQVVKNATIVPSGSKGGFITKRQFPDRDGQLEERRQQYMTLIRGLLDVTDNLVEGKVVPPPDVVRHDGDDPYLVVAADKGTADLSDTANAVAAEYGFWLDDAFASGGSQGYDHKKEGITAKGAWECVKRHFREMGKDIQAEPFTVAGVGDMSGDVFGNGMLLSPVIRLVAAFDHRHVFIDPDPDPARSFAERQRMFDLPRSSWDDYDRSLLSPGAMIVSRASKEIEITPEARRALGLDDEVERLDGEGLVRAVLKAPVELLWNGGIGTYVKSPDETNADVGDTTNDPVRVDSDELRCKVVGEGGNLGFTQKGRVAFAELGGRLNTDALDNSAGVDMSDHEVNLKILLGAVVRSGELDYEGRNRLLASMTDEVNRLVLRNNFGQSLAVSLDEARAREALDDFVSLVNTLARDGRLDPAEEGIPDADGLRARAQARQGLTRPTLAVLLSHAKLQAKAALLAAQVPDDEATTGYLVDYFPRAAVERAGEGRLREYRLRREIVTTELVNDLVNLMGSSFLHRVSRDSGRGIAEVVRAWLVASRIAGAAEIRADMAAAEGRFPSEVVYRWLLGLARVLEQTTQWLLANVPAGADTGGVIEQAHPGLATLRGGFARFVAGEDRTVFLQRLGELQDLGVEKALGERLITLRFLPQLLEIVDAARAAGTEEIRTARAFYAVSEKLGTSRLREGLRAAAGDNPWDRRYAGALTDDLTSAQRAVVAAVLRDGEDPGRALAALEKAHPREFGAFRALAAELQVGDCPMAAFALGVRQLQTVARAVSAG